MKYLLCVYTCDREPYISYLRELSATKWFKKLEKDPEVSIYYVYADESIRAPKLEGNKLVLPCSEDYSLLAQKTYEMIKYFVKNEKFDYLIKVDDSILRQYIGLMLYNCNIKKMCKSMYGGLLIRKINQESMNNFAVIKQLKNLHDSPMSEAIFFDGKLYFLNSNACDVIAEKGNVLLPIFLEKMGGVEDVFVGKVLGESGYIQTDTFRCFLRIQLGSIKRKIYKILFFAIRCFRTTEK